MMIRRFKNNRNFIKKLKQHPSHTLKLGQRRHLTRRSSLSSQRLILPSVFSGYEYNTERGLKPRDFFIRLLASSFRPKIIILITLMLLPLTWWLNSLSAFYALPSEELSSFAKTKKLALPTLSDIVNTKNSTWLPILVNSGDTLSAIFKKHGFSEEDLHQILKLKPFSEKLSKLYPSQALYIKYSAKKNIEELLLELDFAKKLHIYRTEKGFSGKMSEPVPAQIIPVLVDVTTTLFEDGQRAGLSKEMISQLVGICRWDIDFQPIDYLSVIYQKYYFEGKSKEGNILALKIVGQDDFSCEAVRYNSAYYKPNGEPLHNTRKVTRISEVVVKNGTFLVPVQFTKISSDYGMREHPVFGKLLFHKGVDYAAPTGTPVIAAANAIVRSVGSKKGYGKTVILQHDEQHDTLYAHLSDYAEGLVEGKVISQAEVIGYVGQSGTATGPHLHYEYHVDGEPQNPSDIEPEKMIASEEDRKNDTHFFKETQPFLAQLNQLEGDHHRHPTLASQQVASTKLSKSNAKLE